MQFQRIRAVELTYLIFKQGKSLFSKIWKLSDKFSGKLMYKNIESILLCDKEYIIFFKKKFIREIFISLN